ncbi:MAG TPA: SRPBCC family protein [Candidatus Dormibacteraeota bacterium]
MRVEASADAGVRPADLFGVAADLRNLPAWWIEHLSAEVEVPAPRLRDSVYRVRYRLPGGLVISALCTVVAARAGRSLTYVWEGGGMRMAVGQSFTVHGEGTRTRLIADLATDRLLTPVGSVVTRLIGRGLVAELDRALANLTELAAARAVVRRAPLGGGTERRAPGGRPAVSVLGGAAGAAGAGPAGAGGAGGRGLPGGGGGAADAGGRAPGGRRRGPADGGRTGGGGTAGAARGRRRLLLDAAQDPGAGAGGTVDEKKKVARRHPGDVRAPGAAAKRPEA